MLKTIITCQQHSICNKNCYFRAFHRCKIGTPLRPGIFDLLETHVLFLLTHLWYQIQAFATILVNGKRKIIRMINAIPKWNLPATNFDDNSLETLTDRFEYNWYNLTGTLKVLFSPRSYFRHYFFLPIQALHAVKKKKIDEIELRVTSGTEARTIIP